MNNGIIDTMFFAIEMMGLIAFTISGALTAVERRLDVFGVFVLGAATASGGGVIRDLILGRIPPAFFQNSIYVLVVLFVTLLFLLTLRFIKLKMDMKRIETLLLLINLFDALGLGMFTVVGVNTAILSGFGDNVFLCVFVGFITGTGGGILRDMLAGRTPVILRRDVYAVITIAGSFLFYYLRLVVAQPVAMAVAILFVFAIRVVVLMKKMSLPTVSNISKNIANGE